MESVIDALLTTAQATDIASIELMDSFPYPTTSAIGQD
jgi:hypothetical protein